MKECSACPVDITRGLKLHDVTHHKARCEAAGVLTGNGRGVCIATARTHGTNGKMSTIWGLSMYCRDSARD